ncbi:hypothetical protein ACFQL1_15470 [Halomicroarcula sp. GCM10025709]|uniref:DUF7511 domain-containing protein n=1 Tax=Haloarcula TaxID=2237 RepID=UPI0024C31768|nr:hypothetical protein [Halomicroarcula sp. YJ-61-S]
MHSEPDWVADETRQPETPAVELQSTVVRYSDGADRCTVYPPDCPETARLTTWLSADRAVFVDRDAMR